MRERGRDRQTYRHIAVRLHIAYLASTGGIKFTSHRRFINLLGENGYELRLGLVRQITRVGSEKQERRLATAGAISDARYPKINPLSPLLSCG